MRLTSPGLLVQELSQSASPQKLRMHRTASKMSEFKVTTRLRTSKKMVKEMVGFGERSLIRMNVPVVRFVISPTKWLPVFRVAPKFASWPCLLKHPYESSSGRTRLHKVPRLKTARTQKRGKVWSYKQVGRNTDNNGRWFVTHTL